MNSKDVDNIDLLIITNEFLLDDVIAFFSNLSQFDGTIERVYFSLESTPDGFQQEEITKEEFEKFPKHNLYFHNDDYEGYYSTLNYEEFSKAFDFDRWVYCFLESTYIEEEFYTSIKEKLNTFQTDIQSKMFFQSLLQQLTYSDYFLKKFIQEKGCNNIQRRVCEHYIGINEQIYSNLKFEYDIIFSELLINYTLFQDSYTKKQPKNDRLYKIAQLLADKSFSFNYTEENIASYKDLYFKNKSKLAEYFSKSLQLKYNAVQPYINQTLSDTKDNKNIFRKQNLEMLELIVKEKGIENCSEYFKDRLTQLQNSPE